MLENPWQFRVNLAWSRPCTQLPFPPSPTAAAWRTFRRFRSKFFGRSPRPALRNYSARSSEYRQGAAERRASLSVRRDESSAAGVPSDAEKFWKERPFRSGAAEPVTTACEISHRPLSVTRSMTGNVWTRRRPCDRPSRISISSIARYLRTLVDVGLEGAVKTSGAKGVHVFVPIDDQAPLEDAAAATERRRAHETPPCRCCAPRRWSLRSQLRRPLRGEHRGPGRA